MSRDNPDSILNETRATEVKPVNPLHFSRRFVNSLECDLQERRPGLCSLPPIFLDAESGDWEEQKDAQEWSKYFSGRTPTVAEAMALKIEMERLCDLAQIDWRARIEIARQLGPESAENPPALIRTLYTMICNEKDLQP